MPYKRIGGIYIIVNLVNQKKYVGQAVVFGGRWARHRSDLRLNRHDNAHLQSAWNKYGESAFVFGKLETINVPDGLKRSEAKDFLKPYEQWWMDLLKPEYNKCPAAGSPLGFKHTDETRCKMSESGKGRKHSPESLAKMSASQKGHPTSAETKAKISASLTGRKLSPEHAAKSIGRVFDEDARRKISKAGTGRVQSEETKAKRSATLMGHPTSQETKDKISASHKANHAKMRADQQSLEGMNGDSHPDGEATEATG